MAVVYTFNDRFCLLFRTSSTDVRDRAIRYPRAADTGRTAHESVFFGHDFRFSVGGGVRF